MNKSYKTFSLLDIELILKTAQISTKPINIDIYMQSFTHKSFHPTVNYEILEFYGDSIVSAMVVEYLFHRYRNEFNQGQLTIIKNKIVSTHFLAKFAKYFHFEKYIRINKYCHFIQMNKLLEDCFEAFIAAISLDIDYNTAKQFVYFCINNLVNYASLIYENYNYKELILHHFQSKKWSEPIYKLDMELGNYSKKTFIINLYKKDEFICDGIGKTKKEAEMNASYNALILFTKSNKFKINDSHK